VKIAIIGGGLGGLTAGALLAKDGFKVTLFEQHKIVGGCATTFKRGDFICEVGLHDMDNLYNDKIKKEIFERLDVYKNVEFIKIGEFFRVKTKKIDYLLYDDYYKAKEQLKKDFSKNRNEIEKYFKLIKTVYEKFEKIVKLSFSDYLFFPIKFFEILKYKNASVKDVFDKIFSNEELKIILNANIGYYHNSTNLSFLLHCIAQYSYFLGGGWFIKGGSSVLSNYLAKVIKENRGRIFTKANVIQLKENSLIYKNRK